MSSPLWRRTRTLLILATFLSPFFAFAKNRAGTAAAEDTRKVNATALLPEALGARAFLEDLLARRYAQELATRVDRSSFTLGAQLELIDHPKTLPRISLSDAEPEPVSDLMLGSIDPEELIKKYALGDEKATAQGFLTNYLIRTVNISVGISENMAADVKADVEKWLNARVASEFGKSGKGTVNPIKIIDKKETAPKTLWDTLDRFQSLAGQLVLALALLLGVLIWKVLSSPLVANLSQSGESKVINQGGSGKDSAEDPVKQIKQKNEINEIENQRIGTEIERLRQSLNDLVPRLNHEFEDIMRAWCQMGDPGRLRLACFAEAVGKEMGKLPIPVDALKDVAKVFSKMSTVTLPEKAEALQRAYWDLLSAMNLGVESLNQPFGYLGGLNLSMVNQVLMDENPKMRTLVSLYMPDEQREKYLNSLSLDQKREILTSAAGLSEMPAAELRSMDGRLVGKLKPSGSTEMVALEPALKKLVSTLSARDSITLLAEMKGAAIEEFKRTTPSLAFLSQWRDEKLAILMTYVVPDELVAFCRVQPAMQERLLKLCPPLTAEMASEELAREDKTADKIKDDLLDQLAERLENLVASNSIELDDVFAAASASSPEELAASTGEDKSAA